MGEVCGGMYVFTIVKYVLCPVRILIDCISDVVSCVGRRDFVYALVSVKLIVLCTRVMSPPPPAPTRSCRMVV